MKATVEKNKRGPIRGKNRREDEECKRTKVKSCRATNAQVHFYSKLRI
jgi:hypothetical protein